MAGIGIVPEGLMQNYPVYDAVLEGSYAQFANRTAAHFDRDLW